LPFPLISSSSISIDGGDVGIISEGTDENSSLPIKVGSSDTVEMMVGAPVDGIVVLSATGAMVGCCVNSLLGRGVGETVVATGAVTVGEAVGSGASILHSV
jgi:hypothetical protein